MYTREAAVPGAFRRIVGPRTLDDPAGSANHGRHGFSSNRHAVAAWIGLADAVLIQFASSLAVIAVLRVAGRCDLA